MIIYRHGGDIYTRHVRYDFSSNINPLGMPQSVKNALAAHIDDYEHYPDVSCAALRKAIAEYEKTDSGKIVCGNGAADLIFRIVHSLKPKKALLTAPSFSEYEKALKSVDCGIIFHYLHEENNFEIDEKILFRLNNIDMLILAAPNNPTGNIMGQELIKKIIEECCKKNIYLVVDECFMDFVYDSEKYTLPVCGNVMILKAFTKIFAMAGLRLGYLICSDENLIREIENCGQSWSVSVPAQTAGIAAADEREYVKKTVELISQERIFLTKGLEKVGFKVYPSAANFILFRCKIPLDEILINEGIAIRNCSDYRGLGEGYFRIAVRTHEENKILISAVERAVKNKNLK